MSSLQEELERTVFQTVRKLPRGWMDRPTHRIHLRPEALEALLDDMDKYLPMPLKQPSKDDPKLRASLTFMGLPTEEDSLLPQDVPFLIMPNLPNPYPLTPTVATATIQSPPRCRLAQVERHLSGALRNSPVDPPPSQANLSGLRLGGVFG